MSKKSFCGLAWVWMNISSFSGLSSDLCFSMFSKRIPDFLNVSTTSPFLFSHRRHLTTVPISTQLALSSYLHSQIYIVVASMHHWKKSISYPTNYISYSLCCCIAFFVGTLPELDETLFSVSKWLRNGPKSLVSVSSWSWSAAPNQWSLLYTILQTAFIQYS